jgi:predicted HTH transcriptional regulator
MAIAESVIDLNWENDGCYEYANLGKKDLNFEKLLYKVSVSLNLRVKNEKKHESFATNPRIARAMYQVKYIETIGTGLTDLLKECKAKGLRKPLLEEVSGRFRIVIWRSKAVANRGANLLDALPTEQRRICEELLTNPRISSRVLAKVLGIRRNTVLKQFEALKTKGILIRKGGTRGFWEVKEANH